MRKITVLFAISVFTFSSFTTQAQNFELKPSPNPATSKLTVTCTTQAEKLLVYNILGTQLDLGTLEWNEDALGNSVTKLDVSGLPAGVYFVTGVRGREKMTKQFLKE